MTTKKADSKGRVSLGSRFACQTVIIQEVDPTEVRVILAQVIPQRELWLHKNRKAKASVLRGLAQAKAGKAAKSPPDLEVSWFSVKWNPWAWSVAVQSMCICALP